MVKLLHTQHSWGKPFASVWVSNSSNSNREVFLMETAVVYPYFDKKLILKCHLERGCCRWQGRKELQPFQAWTHTLPVASRKAGWATHALHLQNNFVTFWQLLE